MPVLCVNLRGKLAQLTEAFHTTKLKWLSLQPSRRRRTESTSKQVGVQVLVHTGGCTGTCTYRNLANNRNVWRVGPERGKLRGTNSVYSDQRCTNLGTFTLGHLIQFGGWRGGGCIYKRRWRHLLILVETWIQYDSTYLSWNTLNDIKLGNNDFIKFIASKRVDAFVRRKRQTRTMKHTHKVLNHPLSC